MPNSSSPPSVGCGSFSSFLPLTCTTPRTSDGVHRYSFFSGLRQFRTSHILITENIVIAKYIVNSNFRVHLSDALKSLGSFVFPIQPVHQFCSAEAGRLLDWRMPANSRAAASLHSPSLTFSSFGINPIRSPIIIPAKAPGCSTGARRIFMKLVVRCSCPAKVGQQRGRILQ
jgi:hypothetical protein